MADRWVLISGAGSGIGRAVAKGLTAQGLGVVLMGRTAASLQETANILGGDACVKLAVADIRKAKDVALALKKTELPSLYGIVANAGIGGENHYGADDRWHDVIDTNLTGTYLTINEALPYLRAERQAQDVRHIVVISSILARLGVPGYSAYCASKAGLLGLVRSWAAAFASERLLVNAICPGWVKTEMAMDGLKAFSEASGKSFDDVYQEQMAYVPLGKMSLPEEIASFVGYLLSDQQYSITGQCLDMNNGALMP